LSWVDLTSGDARGALASADKCLALAESRGDWAMRAVALGSVGAAYWRLGDLQRAEQVVQQGLQLALQVNDKYAIANGLEVLAWITESCHRPRQTAVLMAAAAQISRSSGARLTSSFVGGFHAERERRVRERLSTEEFQQAWAEGTALNASGIAEVIAQSSPANIGGA
jgi:serine/threonine-protein kinase PknK